MKPGGGNMREKTQRFDPRQVMREQNFEIFHYQDPRPGAVEVHHHDFYEVYFFLSGQVEYRVEGRIYHLEPGDLLLISPKELHQPLVKPDVRYERIVLWIDKDYLDGFTELGVDLTRCFDNSLPNHTNLIRPSSVQRGDVRMRLRSLVRESYGKDYGSGLCATGIFLQFMAELNRLAFQSEAERKETEESEESSPLVSQVLGFIGEHYNEELSLDDLASRFYVSKYHLSHEFSRVVGTSVYRYIMLKRLLIARQMLMDGGAPGTVYSSCGFGDYANFYRAFKDEYGVSPKTCQKLKD